MSGSVQIPMAEVSLCGLALLNKSGVLACVVDAQVVELAGYGYPARALPLWSIEELTEVRP